MILNLYSTYDSKAKAWTLPFFTAETDSIERAWTEIVNDPTSKFGQYPADYTLFRIGQWDAIKGELNLFESKQSIGTGSQFLKSNPILGNSLSSSDLDLLTGPVKKTKNIVKTLRRSNAKKAK